MYILSIFYVSLKMNLLKDFNQYTCNTEVNLSNRTVFYGGHKKIHLYTLRLNPSQPLPL